MLLSHIIFECDFLVLDLLRGCSKFVFWS